jgi:hypothetical protein
MFWNQFVELVFSTPDLHFYDALVIIDLAGTHLSVVNQSDEQLDEDKVHRALNRKGLHIDDIGIHLKQVVDCEADRQNDNQNGVALELERLCHESQHHVHSKGDFN